MIESLLMLVLYLVVLGVIWWGVNQILAVLPLEPAIATVIRVIMMVILVIILILVLFKFVGIVLPLAKLP
jgi:hypothetical protein